MTHHHITMLYCMYIFYINVSFHQYIKSYHNIQVPYPNIQMSYPDIKCHSDVKLLYHDIVMHFAIL